jgi:GTPase
MAKAAHKAGFVNIIGKPNVGKSTLINLLLGERISIISPKAQTTRHRVLGIVNEPDFQLIYSDTPGILDPQYALHENMMRYVESALEDADVLVYLFDINQSYEYLPQLEQIKTFNIPLILVLNKIDLGRGSQAEDKLKDWAEKIQPNQSVMISALNATNTSELLDIVLQYLPEHPPYFPKDALTDKTERFFAAEIIREKIFLGYKQEVPYSTEVVVESFKENKDIIRIRAEIFVERNSQKGILIGKKGAALKSVGVAARKDLEAFFQKQVHLELFVKVEENWRKKQKQLNRFGYH